MRYELSHLNTLRDALGKITFRDEDGDVVTDEPFLHFPAGTPLFHHTQVHPREVIKAALKYNAAAIVLSHNHPSGYAEPGHADRLLTDHLKQALKLVDICLLDHLVVGGMDIVSFAERGWL